jgi:hypothetical protein
MPGLEYKTVQKNIGWVINCECSITDSTKYFSAQFCTPILAFCTVLYFRPSFSIRRLYSHSVFSALYFASISWRFCQAHSLHILHIPIIPLSQRVLNDLYRTKLFAVLWFGSLPTPFPLFSQQIISFSQSSFVSPVQLTDRRGRGDETNRENPK